MPTETKSLIRRPPVVAVMGHIDHGKSTLLDYIRKTNIVDKEFGGITQHISAYEVTHKREDGADQKITFLDTPGHEAFQSMRARGARVADIAILVVSAEDGVKPQTKEAHKAIEEAKIPFIVAINKIDKPGANVERTKVTLAENNIFIEGFGGNIPFVPISAKVGTGIPELLDLIILSADLEELTGNKNISAEGVVIESSRDEKRGVSATLIIKNGTLKVRDFLAAGKSVTPVRAIENFLGAKIEEATFSSPVRITGWDKEPVVGTSFKAFKNKKDAEDAATSLQEDTFKFPVSGKEDMFTIPLIIKVDVSGTGEAIEHEIEKLQSDKVFLKVVKVEAGNIGENEVKTALASPGTIIIGFNVKVDPRAKDVADRNNIEIQTFNIIYKMTEWLTEIITERTPKIKTEEISGSIKILKIFSQNKDKQVIGGKIADGIIKNGSSVRINRRGNIVGEGEILELQQARKKVGEVSDGECGMLVDAKVTIAPGDVLESVIIVER